MSCDTVYYVVCKVALLWLLSLLSLFNSTLDPCGHFFNALNCKVGRYFESVDEVPDHSNELLNCPFRLCCYRSQPFNRPVKIKFTSFDYSRCWTVFLFGAIVYGLIQVCSTDFRISIFLIFFFILTIRMNATGRYLPVVLLTPESFRKWFFRNIPWALTLQLGSLFEHNSKGLILIQDGVLSPKPELNKEQ